MKLPDELAHKGQAVEEWLDLRFYRPLGIRIARWLKPTRVTADQVTLAATLIGVIAGHLFVYQSPHVNALGFALFVLSDLLDSADGQLARLRGTSTRFGRMLDGIGDSLRFISLYAHLLIRVLWAGLGWWGAGLVLAALWSHSLQSATVDFVRNAFLEVGTGKGEADLPEDLPAERPDGWFERAARWLYRMYLRRQEGLFPRTVRLVRASRARASAAFRAEYRRRQQPLLVACSWIGQNAHFLLLGAAGIAGRPGIYLWVVVTFMNVVLLGLVTTHESTAAELSESLEGRVYAESA
jgi:CDP-alcohol phosphatidyltransferase